MHRVNSNLRYKSNIDSSASAVAVTNTESEPEDLADTVDHAGVLLHHAMRHGVDLLPLLQLTLHELVGICCDGSYDLGADSKRY